MACNPAKAGLAFGSMSTAPMPLPTPPPPPSATGGAIGAVGAETGARAGAVGPVGVWAPIQDSHPVGGLPPITVPDVTRAGFVLGLNLFGFRYACETAILVQQSLWQHTQQAL